MTFEVRVDPTADRGLGRCPRRVQVALIEFLFGPLANNPQRVGKPLRSELQGLHAARRGDYGVLYRIDEETKTVYVRLIDHRSPIYRPR